MMIEPESSTPFLPRPTPADSTRTIAFSAPTARFAGSTIGCLPCTTKQPPIACWAESPADITERSETAQRALQAERLAAIGETMTGLAHESRNALQRSKACLEMLIFEVEDRPEALDLVARTMTSAGPFAIAVRRGAAICCADRAEPRARQSVRIVAQIWADVSHTHIKTQVHLQEEAAGLELIAKQTGLPSVHVFRNILENALDVSPTKAQIRIRCRGAI